MLDSFSVRYWLIFLIIIILLCRSDGKKRLLNYKFTKGIVVDKILLPGRRNYDVSYSQWQYEVNKDTFLFVDKRFFANKPVGTKARIIYENDRYDKALVYNFYFWINLPLILIAGMIAFFIFSFWQFARHWNDKSWFSKWR